MGENIKWQPSRISKEERMDQNEHKGCVVWFTGLSGSGKSTLAYELERQLFHFGNQVFVLDGDNVRHGLCSDLGFSEDDRKENIRRVAEVSKLFIDAGFIVPVALISPFREDRQIARSLFEYGQFLEVYVHCPLLECEKRDPKGLYKKAREGLIPNFTGISSPYEEPDNPEMIIRTDLSSVNTSVRRIIDFLISLSLIPQEKQAD
jgi:adenylylsulfate kinase